MSYFVLTKYELLAIQNCLLEIRQSDNHSPGLRGGGWWRGGGGGGAGGDGTLRHHEGNISKMPDFDVFSLLEIRKRKSRSHGIRKKGNGKRKKRAVKRSNTSLKDLSKVLEDHGRHSMLSFLSSLPISVLRILDTEANKFYDRNHQLYDAALLTRCYTQHALRPFIDSEINHKRHFIKIPFINKGIEFIDLPSILKDRSVTSSIPAYFQNSEPPIICYKYNKPIRNTIFNFNKLVSDLDIHANTPES